MSNITIQTLNVTIHLGGQAHPLGGLLAVLTKSAAEGLADAGDQADAPAATAEAPAATTAADVLAFLRSDVRFSKRTIDAVRKAFPAADVVALLNDLVDAGSVVTKRRRADGAVLYQAVVGAEAPAAPVEASAPAQVTLEVDTDDIVDLLRHGDERYSSRTMDAIVKHFVAKGANAEAVSHAVERAVDDEYVEVTTRRRDGAKLYSAA